MATYIVVHAFKDLEDKKKLYQVGDVYPKPKNKKVSEERLKALSTKENKAGKVLIEEEKESE
ncbi:hypothetical protein [Jeotgalibaca porci]|uniref:hypothetical protein n=1 Tax=Jeotgalibaca porci TaxID=1868793 RepID=UPI0035A0A51E